MLTYFLVLGNLKNPNFLIKTYTKINLLKFGTAGLLFSYLLTTTTNDQPASTDSLFSKLVPLMGDHAAAECCGIVGYIGSKPIAGDVCIQGLQILESRGYDSCGIVTIDENGRFVRTKFASSDRFGGDCIKRMELEGTARHKHYIGLGHTRWATHGDKTDVNAHPHYDHKERIALIHNGLIENYH